MAWNIAALEDERSQIPKKLSEESNVVILSANFPQRHRGSAEFDEKSQSSRFSDLFFPLRLWGKWPPYRRGEGFIRQPLRPQLSK